MNKPKIKKRNKYGFYTIDGKLYRSVTTYLNVFGTPMSMVEHYYCKRGFEEACKDRNEKGEYGSMIHDMLYSGVFTELGGGDSISDQIGKRLMHISEWFIDNKIYPIFGEKVVWSKKLKTAGTIDFIGVCGDQHIVILDYKTGAKSKIKELLQLAAYGQCLVENQHLYKLPFPITFDNILGATAHVGRDDEVKPAFKLYSNDIMQTALKGFKGLVSLYKFMDGLKRR